ncbi:hypothetical protein BS78_02G134400 [Paspalum vaginatum]|nr:hypothetical protein BS78_02G134400 [Paspalum vaginatum]
MVITIVTKLMMMLMRSLRNAWKVEEQGIHTKHKHCLAATVQEANPLLSVWVDHIISPSHPLLTKKRVYGLLFSYWQKPPGLTFFLSKVIKGYTPPIGLLHEITAGAFSQVAKGG